MSDWKIDGDCAWRSWPSPFARDVEIELSDDVLTVEATIGSGYMRESTSSPVPVCVIVALLRNAGFVVTEPSRDHHPRPSEACADDVRGASPKCLLRDGHTGPHVFGGALNTSTLPQPGPCTTETPFSLDAQRFEAIMATGLDPVTIEACARALETQALTHSAGSERYDEALLAARRIWSMQRPSPTGSTDDG